jgi:hypothetical protein
VSSWSSYVCTGFEPVTLGVVNLSGKTAKPSAHYNDRTFIDRSVAYVGWDWRLRTAAIPGLLFVPLVNEIVGAVVMMMQAGYNSWHICQGSLAVLLAEIYLANRRNGRRNENFAYSLSLIRQGIFYTPWNLTAWDPRLYFPSEGRCAANFYRH